MAFEDEVEVSNETDQSQERVSAILSQNGQESHCVIQSHWQVASLMTLTPEPPSIIHLCTF